MLKKGIAFLAAFSMIVTLLPFMPQKQVQALEDMNYSVVDGKMSREVMDRYLSKAVTITNFVYFDCYPDQRADWLRFIANTGTKLISRAAYCWDDYQNLDLLMYCSQRIEPDLHAQDPQCIMEGSIFETTSISVNDISIPEWVFQEFDIPVVTRNFNYSDMLYSDGRYLNFWGTNSSVPDISKLETQMFEYYIARRYIDIGFEAITFGQTRLTGEVDPYYCNWNKVMNRVRNYARDHARRGFVLINSHQTDLYDNCNSLWYSAKDQARFKYDTSTPELFGNDNSRLTQSGGSQSVDGSYIIYKLSNITDFTVLTANSAQYGALDFAYDIQTSPDGIQWTASNYSSLWLSQNGSSWYHNYQLKNISILPVNTNYLKISFKVFPVIGLAQLMNVQINSASASIYDTLDEPNPAVKKLGLDYMAYPIRAKAVSGTPQNAVLEIGYIDSVYKRVIGGLNPQGFVCENSPYLVELDNNGGNNGNPGVDVPYWLWGYDDITWFAHQESGYRQSWLEYVVNWLEINDSNGHFAMPGFRCYLPANGVWDNYSAIGFGDEATIRKIFLRTDPAILNHYATGTDSLTDTGKMVDCIDGNTNAFEFAQFGPNSNKKDSGILLSYYYPLATSGGLLVSNGIKPYAVWKVNDASKVELLIYVLSLGDVELSFSKDGTNYTNFTSVKAKRTRIDSQQKVIQYNLSNEMEYGDPNFAANFYEVDIPSNGGDPVYLKITMKSDYKYSTGISMVRTAAQTVFSGTDSMTTTSALVDCIDGNPNAFEFGMFGPTGYTNDSVMILSYFYPWVKLDNLNVSNWENPDAVWRVKDSSWVDVLAYYFIYDQTGMRFSYSVDGENYIDFANDSRIEVVIDSPEKVLECNLADQMKYKMEYFTSKYYSMKTPANGGNPVYIKLTYDSQNNYSTAIGMFRANEKMVSPTLNINRTTNMVTGMNRDAAITTLRSKFTASSGAIRVVDIFGAEITSGVVKTGLRVQLVNGSELADELRVVVKGDTDGDGSVTVGDLAGIKSHILKQTLLSGPYKTAGDISLKGAISVSDLLIIKKSILGIGGLDLN